MAEIKTLADELRTSQNSVIRRIEQLCTSQEKERECKCSHRTEEMRADIAKLQSNVEELIVKVKADVRRQERLVSDVRTLESRLDSVERLLLSKQTDDSKLSRTALKISALKNDEDLQAGKVESLDKHYKKANGMVGVVNEFEQRQERDIKLSRKISMPLQKPNFTVKQQTHVGLVEQDVRVVYDAAHYWGSIYQNELDFNRSLFSHLDGIHSIICLDISKSMSEGNGWTQARTFLTDYLNGLVEMSKRHNLKTEHVALITFGHETKFQKKFTDKYSEVLEHIDNIKLGGPSQLYGGLFYALSGVCCFKKAAETLDNDFRVFSKVIVVSDGKPTEADLVAGPDIEDTSKINETRANILRAMGNFRNHYTDMFFVPVGNSDMTFLETMESCSEGVMLTYKSGRRLARWQYLSSQLLDPLGLVAGVLTFDSEDNFSQEDKEDLRNIQQRQKHVKSMVCQSNDRDEMHFENNSSALPAVGSRVRRGPDRIHDMQDSYGPGTVIGHSDNGKDWNNIRKPRKNGVITLHIRSKEALALWDDGTRGDYNYDAIEEIKVNSRTQKRSASEGSQKTENHLHTLDDSRIAKTIEEYAARKKVNKNKNKT